MAYVEIPSVTREDHITNSRYCFSLTHIWQTNRELERVQLGGGGLNLKSYTLGISNMCPI